jgi:CheY-like chemotaxis protein
LVSPLDCLVWLKIDRQSRTEKLWELECKHCLPIAGLFMNHKRILTIDDEEAIQIVIEFGIKMAAGWEVLSANSGKQGIEIAQTELPDAILLDMMMPEMDGVETFKALQANPITAKIPVIFLSANDRTDRHLYFDRLDISGTIAKPFNALDLPDLITKILNW